MHIPNLLHRPRDQNVAHDREENHDENPTPSVSVPHDLAPVADARSTVRGDSDPCAPFLARSGDSVGAPPLASVARSCDSVGAPLLADFARSGGFPSGSAVNAGPPATNPTPPEISAIPSQRTGLTCSCSANFATNASKTYPSEVAGKT